MTHISKYAFFPQKIQKALWGATILLDTQNGNFILMLLYLGVLDIFTCVRCYQLFLLICSLANSLMTTLLQPN